MRNVLMRSYLVLMFNQVQVLVNFNARAKVDQPFIAYLSQILTLAKMHYLPNCQIKSCNKQVSVEKAVVGSALYLKWVCINTLYSSIMLEMCLISKKSYTY